MGLPTVDRHYCTRFICEIIIDVFIFFKSFEFLCGVSRKYYHITTYQIRWHQLVRQTGGHR